MSLKHIREKCESHHACMYLNSHVRVISSHILPEFFPQSCSWHKRRNRHRYTHFFSTTKRWIDGMIDCAYACVRVHLHALPCMHTFVFQYMFWCLLTYFTHKRDTGTKAFSVSHTHLQTQSCSVGAAILRHKAKKVVKQHHSAPATNTHVYTTLHVKRPCTYCCVFGFYTRLVLWIFT